MSLVGPAPGAQRSLSPTALRSAVVLGTATTVFVLASVVRPPSLRPDLMAAVLVFVALEHELVPGVFLSLGVGYLNGLFARHAPGLDPAVAVLVFASLRLFVVRLVGSPGFTVTLMTLFATALAFVFRAALRVNLGGEPWSLGAVEPALVSLGVTVLVLAYPLYAALRALDDRVRPRDEVRGWR